MRQARDKLIFPDPGNSRVPETGNWTFISETAIFEARFHCGLFRETKHSIDSRPNLS